MKLDCVLLCKEVNIVFVYVTFRHTGDSEEPSWVFRFLFFYVLEFVIVWFQVLPNHQCRKCETYTHLFGIMWR